MSYNPNARNKRIQDAVKATGLKHWQVARLLGVDDTTLGKWIHKELSDDKQDEIIERINSLDCSKPPIRDGVIENTIRTAGLTQTKIAEHIGMNSALFSTKLRRGLTITEKEAVYKAIEELSKSKDGTPILFTDKYNEGFNDGYMKCLEDTIEMLRVKGEKHD